MDIQFDEFERKCFVILSRRYLDLQITDGCSDFDAVKEAGLTLEECDILHQRMHDWNVGGRTDSGEEPGKGKWFQDWFLFGYLRSKFLRPGEK